MNENEINANTSYHNLNDRALITISGEDRYEFLQGLISNDVNKCSSGVAIWSALLTAQGKYLYDFFVYERDDNLVIECSKEDLMPLGQLLRKYQLRSKVSLGIDSSSKVLVCWDIGHEEFGLSQIKGALVLLDECMIYADPRHSALGVHIVGGEQDLSIIINKFFLNAQKIELYEEKRVSLGIPDGKKDIEVNKGLLLEYGFEELGGVDWDKGCYMGQELTARTKYRALIKKRLFPVVPEDGTWGDALPTYGSKITCDGKEIGEIRSVGKNGALAFIRMDRWAKAILSNKEPIVADSHVMIKKPEWMQLDGTFDLAI